MSEYKKNARSDAATSERANGITYANCSHICNLTRDGADRQGRIFAMLPSGEKNALPAAELAKLAGYKNQRTMRAAIDRERARGLLVLASDAGYFRPAAGDRGIAEIYRFLRRQDGRAASNRRITAKMRAALKAVEKAPLDGQETMWGGE